MQATNWPLVVALLLILLKQLYKLFVHNRPDRIDYFKAVANLPLDISFLVVGLFIKAASTPSQQGSLLIALMIAFLLVSFIATVLWRVCEDAIKIQLTGRLAWAFPLNAAITGSTFYLVLEYVK